MPPWAQEVGGNPLTSQEDDSSQRSKRGYNKRIMACLYSTLPHLAALVQGDRTSACSNQVESDSTRFRREQGEDDIGEFSGNLYNEVIKALAPCQLDSLQAEHRGFPLGHTLLPKRILESLMRQSDSHPIGPLPLDPPGTKPHLCTYNYRLSFFFFLIDTYGSPSN